MELCIV